ncbi:MAG: tRNA 2-thiouridine(34) synthase MnmA [Gammaproteobacteria bacterium]
MRVVVGLSGGVDSAVAALLLLEQGHDVAGLFMKNWDEDDEEGHCPAEQDLADARAVCECLGIALHKVSFSAQYWDRVFRYFLDEYQAGRTPNPDVMCNKEIKFRAFLDHALDLGADRIATGHYARLHANGVVRLLKGTDPDKDQTYFLHSLAQDQLSRSLFPIGHLHKPEVRRIAADAGFPNHAKKDSTGICFIGERKFRDFLGRYLPAQPGEIRSVEGETLGTHHGLIFYTQGQRQGLGIGGQAQHAGEPWYVAGKDLQRNVLLVAQGHDHAALYRRTLLAAAPSWIAGRPPRMPLRCGAKVRYRQAEQPCTVSGLPGERCRVEFDQPQRAVTPGQAVVFYDGDECLGGATIEAAEGEPWAQ